MHLVEILNHFFSLGLCKSLHMAYYHLRIASDFYILCSHLPGYGKLGQHGLVLHFIVGGHKIQLDCVPKTFSIRACQSDTDSTLSVS